MKATGIVRRIDDLGRVVIPKEIRRTMRMRSAAPCASARVTRHRRHWKNGRNSGLLCWIWPNAWAGISTYRRKAGIFPGTLAEGSKILA